MDFENLKKEFGYNKKKHKDTANDYARRHHKSDESNSYIHRPALLFHNIPRTLRRGSEKDGEPLCTINSSAFWREFSVQSVPNLPDIIDPCGVVWLQITTPVN